MKINDDAPRVVGLWFSQTEFDYNGESLSTSATVEGKMASGLGLKWAKAQIYF